MFAAILRASSLLSNLPRTQAVRAARRAALWGLGGPPFCKPFGKCFVSGYRTREARLLVSFEASAAALQQLFPTLRQTQPKFTVGFVSGSLCLRAALPNLIPKEIALFNQLRV